MLKQFARVILCCMAWAAAVVPQVLHAQAFPSKPIRMIVPWPPGGGTDIVARTVAQKMGENLGQPVIIENKPGAAAIIGTDLAAKAEADGYTVLMGNLGPNAANAALYKQLPYDVVKDFAPVSLVATAPYIMVVHPSVSANSVREFIDLAKKSPGKLNFGTGGIGSPPHLATELFAMLAGVQMEHVPYKGGAAHTAALLGGQVQLTLNSPLEVLPHARAGKLRALAITTGKRSEIAPELPTLAESGVPGYEFLVWWGMLAPARTPAAIVSTLNKEAVKAVQAPDVRERMAKLGATVVGSTPQEFAAYISTEIEKWKKVAQEAKLPQQ
jgi:tripartite-type tricarboxylate transporter receptor subunit TctC